MKNTNNNSKPILHYSRYKVKQTMEFDSIEEALEEAANDIEFGASYPIKIEKDGKTIKDQKQILQYWKNRYGGIK